MRFKDKVVIITGAGSGIGLQAARMFSAEGAIVAINDLHEDGADNAVRSLNTQGGQSMAIPGNAADPQVASRSVAHVMEKYGRVDVLVNNAGIFHLMPAKAVEADRWHAVISTNLDSVFFWSQAVATASMIERRDGAIVNVASVAGLAGVPNAAAYVASKHGVVGLTKALAIEWGQYNIRVNAVCPGLTWTAMPLAAKEQNPAMFEERERRIPLGRAATPEDQGNAILFLASAQAASVHGLMMAVDGGTTAMSSGSSVQIDAPRSSQPDSAFNPAATIPKTAPVVRRRHSVSSR